MDKFGVWNRNIYGAHIAVCPNVPACLDEKNMQVSGTEIWKTLLVEHPFCQSSLVISFVLEMGCSYPGL